MIKMDISFLITQINTIVNTRISVVIGTVICDVITEMYVVVNAAERAKLLTSIGIIYSKAKFYRTSLTPCTALSYKCVYSIKYFSP
jgi:hypothetical protein